MAASRDPFAAKRLDSWKEIAVFFGRSERTVRRWEEERGMPIHRLPGSRRSAVFAYEHELSEWLQSRKQELELEQPAPDVDEELDSRSVDLSAQEISEASRPSETESPLPSVPLSHHKRTTHTALWISALALGMVLIVLLSLGHVGPRMQALAGRNSSNSEAKDLYLKGRYYWSRRTPEDITKAIDYFTQAIVKDPNDAQAYVGLADCYNLLREFGAMPVAEAYPRALAAAQRAVELDDKSAEAHNSLAFATFWWTWHGATAEREFKRALELDPTFVRAHHWYATYLMAVYRDNEALDQINQAQHLEPASPAILADKATLLWSIGRRQEALALLQQLQATEPTLSSTYTYLGLCYWRDGEYEKALQQWKRAAELRHDEAGLAIIQARIDGYTAGGLRESYERSLAPSKEAVERGSASAYDLATAYAELGRTQEALTYLKLSLDRHEEELLTAHPPIPSLQQEPAYRAVLAQRDALLAQ